MYYYLVKGKSDVALVQADSPPQPGDSVQAIYTTYKTPRRKRQPGEQVIPEIVSILPGDRIVKCYSEDEFRKEFFERFIL